MNGDGQVEALFVDEGPCYKPDGRWYAVAAQSPDGAWRRILEGEGSLHATGAASTDGSSWPRPAPAGPKSFTMTVTLCLSRSARRAQRRCGRPIGAPDSSRRSVRGRQSPRPRAAAIRPRVESACHVRATAAGRAGVDPHRGRLQARRQGLEGLRRLVERRKGRRRDQGSERRRPAGSRHHRFEHGMLWHGRAGVHHPDGGSGRLEDDGARDRHSDVSRCARAPRTIRISRSAAPARASRSSAGTETATAWLALAMTTAARAGESPASCEPSGGAPLWWVYNSTINVINRSSAPQRRIRGVPVNGVITH